MNPENLPSWVLQLVGGLTRYEDEHPTLYAQYAGSTTWERAHCPGLLLAAVPDDVRAFVAARSQGGADEGVRQ